jgi:NADH-quinone oxidoreductase subunit J
MASMITFFILAAIAVVSAVMVVVNTNPVRSALSLVVTFLAVAAFYVTLSAQFIAAVQIIVYAGAIMVLFLFVIMLLNLGAPIVAKEKGKQQSVAIVLAVIFVTLISVLPMGSLPGSQASESVVLKMGTVENIGKNLYSPVLPWLFPFEITSILLLVAVIGAIIMAKRRI